MSDEAFPGVRLHVVTSKPPEGSPMPRIDSSLDRMTAARRTKTLEDLKSADEGGGRFATNVQWAALVPDSRSMTSITKENSQTSHGSKEKKEKKHKSKEREDKKEKKKETEPEAIDADRQRRRNEPKPRPMRQMSTGAISALTSDYVKIRPDSKPRATLVPPASLPGKGSRTAAQGGPASQMGRHSNADMRPELQQQSGQARSDAPKGRFFGRPMEELLTSAKEGQGAPSSLFSTRTSLSHVPSILFALAEVAFRRGVKGNVHGLFRISGRAGRIAELRDALDALPQGDLKSQAEKLLDGEDVHVITGLFKLLLREQPEPLVPSSFRCLTDQGEQEDKLLQGRTLISLMTSKHRASFFYVFELLARVRDEKELRMSSTALGVVFGPVVMRVNETDLAQFHIASAVVEAIIDHFLALTVPTPSSLLSPRGSQIRQSQINQSLRALSYSPPPTRLPGVESSSSTTSPNGSALLASSGANTATAALTDVQRWTPAEVSQWVTQLGLPSYASAFKEHQIDGQALLELDRFDLQDMGVRLIGHQKTILRNIRTLSPGE